MENTELIVDKPVFKFNPDVWDELDTEIKVDQPKLCKIADPDCESCQ